MYEIIRTAIADREKTIRPFWSHGTYETRQEAEKAMEMFSLFDNCMYDFKIEAAA